MAQQLFTNNALSLLNTAIGPTDLIIEVITGDGHLYPQPLLADDYFIITIEDPTSTYREIIRCSGRSGDQLIVDPLGRGYEGTTAQYWAIDSLVDHRATAHFYNQAKVNGESSSATTLNIVSPAATGNADTFTISYPNQLACKWIITVLDPISDRVSVCEVLACYRGAVNPPMFSVYARTGDKLHYLIEVDVSGSALELNVTNEDTVPLQINWIRINN